MENKESLKEIIDNQQHIRLQLTDILIKKKISRSALAKDIGINRETLHRFLRLGKDIELFLTLMKVKEYIVKNS